MNVPLLDPNQVEDVLCAQVAAVTEGPAGSSLPERTGENGLWQCGYCPSGADCWTEGTPQKVRASTKTDNLHRLYLLSRQVGRPMTGLLNEALEQFLFDAEVNDRRLLREVREVMRGRRRLIKRENGAVTELWSDSHNSYGVDESFTLSVDVIGSRIVGYLNDTRIFEKVDSTYGAGKIGLFCSENPGARFERVEVSHLPLEAYALLRDRFAMNDTTGWLPVDEATGSKSNWTSSEGKLHQTAPMSDTYVLNGESTWTDVVISVRFMSSVTGSIGLLFRYVDENHFYRFSMQELGRAREESGRDVSSALG